MNPINIIGAGMAGSILAKLLRKEGIEFRLFDAKKPGAASQISENLIGVNWYKNQREQVSQAVKILRSIVPVRLIDMGKNSALHVYTQDLLETEFINEEVKLGHGGCYTGNEFGGQTFPGFTIVCAGVWSKLLHPSVDVESVVGHGVAYPGSTKEEIKPYKPFRFEKLINRNPNETWYSNSLSVSEKTYRENSEKYRAELFEAAAKNPILLGREGEYRHGFRPFTATHNNLMIQNGMVITGGYKSGMLYYPLQCKSAVDFILDQARFL